MVFDTCSSAEKDLGVLVDIKLTMSQKCTLVAKKVDSILDCIRRSTASVPQDLILPLLSSGEAISMSSSGLPSTRKKWTYWGESRTGL